MAYFEYRCIECGRPRRSSNKDCDQGAGTVCMVCQAVNERDARLAERQRRRREAAR